MLRIRETLGCFFALTWFGCTSGGAATHPTALDAAVSPGVEAAACTSRMIVASSFDQSCVSDFDCVGVAEGNACEACGLVCPLAAISKRALPAYLAAIANSPAEAPGMQCLTNCPNYGMPCCNSGQCTDQCPDMVLSLSDCAEAGGACVAIDSLPDAAPTCSRLGDCPISVSQFGVCCPVVDAGGGE
ncbi:MAG: hypothetical protein ACLP1X_31520 [Polyangiaceae bacterium]